MGDRPRSWGTDLGVGGQTSGLWGTVLMESTGTDPELRAGRGSKTLFLWLLRSGSSIVSIPQKTCSALLHGFESRNRDWEPKNLIFVYNAFALPLHLHFVEFELFFVYN